MNTLIKKTHKIRRCCVPKVSSDMVNSKQQKLASLQPLSLEGIRETTEMNVKWSVEPEVFTIEATNVRPATRCKIICVPARGTHTLLGCGIA